MNSICYSRKNIAKICNQNAKHHHLLCCFNLSPNSCSNHNTIIRCNQTETAYDKLTCNNNDYNPTWNTINAEQTSNLSANGSINLPKLVTKLYFLAIIPSNISVMDAIANIANAIQLPKGMKPP